MNNLDLVSTRKLVNELASRSAASVIILIRPKNPDDHNATEHDRNEPFMTLSLNEPGEPLAMVQALCLMNKASNQVHLMLADALAP